MGMFGSYIQTILIIGICAFLCESIQTASCSGISKALRLITSLCIFLCIISPFTLGINRLFGNLNKDFEYNNRQNFNSDVLTELTQENLQNNLKEKIIEKFGIHVHSIVIDLNVVQNEFKVLSVNLVTDKEGVRQHKDIENFIVENLGNTTVIINEQTNDY